MKNNILKPLCKYAFMLVGIILSINALFLLVVANLHTGIFLTLILGITFLMYGVFFNFINSKIAKWIRVSFYICIFLGIAALTFLFTYGIFDNVTYNEDAIIVLGSGVQGEALTANLRKRLDKAIEYHHENPDATIVLSGGKGPQEDITESLAMERYMIANGVPRNKLIQEDASTSTHENFLYSKEILDELFKDNLYNVAFISNDFHIYRAKEIAKTTGFSNIKHYHTSTQWYTVIASSLRECLAIIKFWLFNR